MGSGAYGGISVWGRSGLNKKRGVWVHASATLEGSGLGTAVRERASTAGVKSF